jgi:methionyl-tRNA formyltransferase
VAWTIILGERAAVNLFCLTGEPDAGDIIVQREVPVLPDDYSEDLIARTNDVLGEVILELAPLIKRGELPRRAQDHSRATYYAKRRPADGLIRWSRPTDTIYRLVRAAGRPYPGAFSFFDGRKVTVWRGQPAGDDRMGSGTPEGAPGMIVDVDSNGGLLVRTGDGVFRLTEISGVEKDELRPGLQFSLRA